ncbi:alpha/beta hydrolase [Salipaludibacillus sp. CUR1]|uniref:alpha/beta fold hydrolase n=1 Tax=Salipaludibacillus sp. CUR1 TaxID=2820003 RepID=UPI001E617AA7|nr:alpha/beta hydrolase [Salipaludibacillus sp. CUR1]MCE7792168.1 alpha/beta hydrolase [Salipaludibacillus sp. CUR1]
MEKTSNGKLINIRGKDMYVESYGSENNTPLLYIHGGPGQGCYDFCYHQAERLQEDVRLIAVDQRGVSRSEGIKKEEGFSLNDIILDFEELRKELGIEKWALLGHSFGGYFSLLYATTFPKSVSHIIFECPTFDSELSARNSLIKASKLFSEVRKETLAEKCLELSKSDKPAKDLMLEFMDIRPELGEKGIEIHVHNFEHPTDYSLYTEDEWKQFFEKNNVHNDRLFEENEIFNSLLPRLNEVTQPALLINGKYDPVTCDEQKRTFLSDVKHGESITLQDSGHFPHFEEPEKFKNVVLNFLK